MFLFTPKIGEDSQFDEHIFQMGGSTTNQIYIQLPSLHTNIVAEKMYGLERRLLSFWGKGHTFFRVKLAVSFREVIDYSPVR